jgi:hypothetical protein
VNGSLRNDNNATRGLTRDQDNTGVVPLTTGWNRVLFKVHNFTGGFQGTVSLRNNTNVNLNASINSYDLGGGYYSHSVGYEQDAWYPQIALTSVYGVSGPINGTAFFGNNTTITASGTSNGQGPVPYWRTMQYQWGHGLDDADSDYADVSGAPTSASWSHTTIGVTGHRRFHFFAVSQSGRTSFQNSGRTGGSVFQDAGNYARYYDVYVDNLAPESPDLIGAAAGDTSTVNLQWIIPLDQGVNIGPGDNESLGAAGNQDGQNWYRVGDVGVQLYRNGSVVASWGTGTSFSDAGLIANTSYTYAIEARDNNSGLRGPWHNSTGQRDTNVVWTLSVPPTALSINASPANGAVGSNITWTAASGFGPGVVEYYRYAWDRSPMHTFTDSETRWSIGAISTVPDVTGTWYLHVKGYNGADIGNGTFDYAINVSPAEPLQISSINASSGLVTLSWNAVSGMVYRVQYTPDLSANGWSNLVPDVQATNSTATASDDTTGAAQRFYRVMQLP